MRPVRWVAAHADELGVDPHRLLLGGGSSGGGLAAATALRTRDEGGPSLAGLPPTLIDVGSADLFRDQDVAFASAIWACGGDAELHVWPGHHHGFELLAPAAPLSRDTVAAGQRWMERTVAKAAR